MGLYVVTTDVTTFYSLEVNADNEAEAEELAEETPIHEWAEENTEHSFFYEIKKVR